jgi:hypothetical protein
VLDEERALCGLGCAAHHGGRYERSPALASGTSLGF